MNELAGLLMMMMNKHNAVFEVVLLNLQTLLEAHHEHPPISLIPVVVALPWDKVPSLVEDHPKKCLGALLRLLCSCKAERLIGIIAHLVKLLEKQVRVIKCAAEETLTQMLLAMLNSKLRDQLEETFFALLFGCQTSSRAFNQILPILGTVINELLATIDVGSMRLADKLSEAAIFHYFRFPGLVFPGDLREILHSAVPITTQR